VLNRRSWLASVAAGLAGCAGGPRQSRHGPRPAAPPPPPQALPPDDPPPQLRPPPADDALPLIRPPRLRRGDTVGLFAPSTRVSQDLVDRGVAQLEELGFRVRVAPHVLSTHLHYAGTAAQRADDLQGLWADDGVRALWAVNGGAGASALLPLLDYAAMRRQPKALIGFSDITALHLAVHKHAGLVTFHGPFAGSRLTPYTVDALQAVLMQPQARTVLRLSDDHRQRAEAEPQFRARSIRAGVAEGRLLGGNLSLLAALVGTPFAADYTDALLFMEDVREAPYRVDRMLTQLQQSLGLQRAAGLVAGVFDRCEVPSDALTMPLASVFDAQFGAAGVPAVYGWSFGHVRDQLTLPLGVRARLDTEAQTLTLLEPAVT
jgi:muramoyltetrapeptide carboxypeptidase